MQNQTPGLTFMLKSKGTLFWPLFIILLLVAQTAATYPNLEFVKKSIEGSNLPAPESLATSSDGSVYVTGCYASTMTIGSQSYTPALDRVWMYLAKFDAQGQNSWFITGGADGFSYGMGLALGKDGDNDHLYVSGYFFGEMTLCDSTFGTGSFNSGIRGLFTAQFNAIDGQCKWVSPTIPTSNSAVALDVTVANDGTILMSGYVSGPTTFDSITVTPSGEDIIVVQYNNMNGEYLSVITAGGSGSDRAVAITVDEEDSLYITGYFENEATFGACGQVSSMGAGDIFFGKYNRSGDCVWVSTAGGIYPDQGRDIVFGKDGFLYLSGYFALSASFGSQTLTSLGGDAFVSKIDAQTGEYIWLSQVKSSYEIFANSLAVGNNGVVYVAGQSRGTCQFSPQLEVNSRGRDVFLAAYNTENGNALWVETGSGPGSENTYGVGVAGTSLYYTGSFGGYGTFPTFFGDVSLTSPGIFLAKYNLTCDEGYFGINCEITTCFGTNSTDNQTCSSNGECSAFDHCNCDPDWKGDNCDTPTCYGLNHTDFNVCSQHGSCVSANVCLCSSYYFGDRCEMTSCFGAQSNLTQVCSGNGECISHDNCECDSGWFGDNCTISSCFGIMGNLSEVCSGHGVCSSLDFCSCLNYTGNWCQIAWCFGLNNSDQNVCHGRGVCSGYNQCNCTSGSSGSDCSIPLCNSIEATNSSVCSGNGNCVDVNTCNCSSDYGGLFCDKSPQSERGMKSKSRTGLIVGVTVGSIGGVILLLFLVLASVISIVIITKLKGAQLNKSVLPSQQLEMMDMGI